MHDLGNTQPIRTSGLFTTADELARSYRTAPCLTVVWHPETDAIGRRIMLRRGRTVTIGRGGPELGDGMLEDRRISRKHVEFAMAQQHVRVRDLCSLNGTLLNGRPVTEAVLQAGDRIEVGSVLFLFHRGLPEEVRPAHRHLVGDSAALAGVIDAIECVSPYDTTVLVLGESGKVPSKELVARSIHEESSRRGPLLMVNCGGMPDTLLHSELFGHARGAFSGAERDREGLVQAANGGTLFLDEIGDASPGLQASLLRFLQEGEVRPLGSNTVKRVDTRVIAATHRDLRQMVARGEFREDLYARLSAWTIEIPPLRERPEDITPLVQHFARLCGGPGCKATSRRLTDRLLGYDWPRNVRELELVVRRAAIESRGRQLRLTPTLEASLTRRRPRAVPSQSRPGRTVTPPPRAQAPDVETLTNLLARARGNVKRVAATLGVARTTAYRWIRNADLDPDDYRATRTGIRTEIDMGDGGESTEPHRTI